MFRRRPDRSGFSARAQAARRAIVTAAALGLSLAALHMSPAVALAQDSPAPPEQSPPRLLAERLLQLVDASLEGQGQPRTDQLVRARILLDQALKLAPDDAESWRLRIELADRLDDKPGALDALRAYCRLKPEDDAAQWDLIQRLIAQRQTIEQRTTAVANLADGESAATLSPALRSRLETYLARAAQERGDTREFAARLRSALAFDAANPRAAALAHEFAVARQAAPLEIGATLLGLVRAAPTDPYARAQLGQLLLSQGAYAAAAAQLSAAKNVSLAPLPPHEAVSYYSALVIALAGGGQTGPALALLNQLDAAWSPTPATAPGAAAAPAAETSPSATASAAPATGPASAPSASTAPAAAPALGAGLPPELELLRAALLKRDGGPSRAEPSLHRLREHASRAPAGRASDPDAAADRAGIELLFLDAPADANAKPDAKALAAIQALVEKVPAELPAGQRLRGWLLLRTGQPQPARQALTPLAAKDPFSSYGLALTYPASAPERRQWLQKTVEQAAATVPGLMAALDLREAGSPVAPTPAGAALTEKIAEWPRLLANPNPAEQAWIVLSLDLSSFRPDFLEPILARVRLRNATEFPLALGPEGTVPTRLFLLSTLRPGQSAMRELPPHVVDLFRRLRLDARATLDLTVRLDRNRLGGLLASSGGENVHFTTLAMLDAYPGPRGRLVTGPLGAAELTRLIERQGYPPAPPKVAAWIEALAPMADPASRFKALALLPQAARRAGAADAPEARELAGRIVKALVEAFPKLDAASQAWALTFLPTPDEPGGDLYRPVHESAGRSTDALVRMIELAATARDPKAPGLNAAIRSEIRPLVEFAQAFRTSLEQAPAKAREDAATAPAALPPAATGR